MAKKYKIILTRFDIKDGPVEEVHEAATKEEAASLVLDLIFKDGATGITLYPPAYSGEQVEHYRVDYYPFKGVRGITRVIPPAEVQS